MHQQHWLLDKKDSSDSVSLCRKKGRGEKYVKLKKIHWVTHGSSAFPRVTHGIDLRQTCHESFMGTFYVDDFDVNRCNDRPVTYVEAERTAAELYTSSCRKGVWLRRE